MKDMLNLQKYVTQLLSFELKSKFLVMQHKIENEIDICSNIEPETSYLVQYIPQFYHNPILRVQ